MTIDTSEPQAFSRIIADDLCPAVTFRGDPDERPFAPIERITFGEWGVCAFRFARVEDPAAMDTFEKTGALFLSVGTVSSARRRSGNRFGERARGKTKTESIVPKGGFRLSGRCDTRIWAVVLARGRTVVARFATAVGLRTHASSTTPAA